MKRRSYAGALLVVAAAGIVGGWTWVNSKAGSPSASPPASMTRTSPSPVAPVEKTTTVSFDPQPPKHIDVPAVGISAPVVPVGKEPDGAMEAPRDNVSVGWYETGYLPGSQGNAVLAGHYGDDAEAGAFRPLEKLRPHDIVRITTATRVMKFEVQKKTVYRHDAGRRKELFGESKYAQLQLITCDGAWDPARSSYTDRLAVTARFVSEKPL